MLALNNLRESILCFSLNIKVRSARAEITWYQWYWIIRPRLTVYTGGRLLGTIGLF